MIRAFQLGLIHFGFLLFFTPAHSMNLSGQEPSQNFVDRGYTGVGKSIYRAVVTCEEGEARDLLTRNDHDQPLTIRFAEAGVLELRFVRPQLLGTYSAAEYTLYSKMGFYTDDRIFETTREFFGGFEPEGERSINVHVFRSLLRQSRDCCAREEDRSGSFRVYNCSEDN